MGEIKFGNLSISNIFYGNIPVSSVYYGSTLVWGSAAPVESLEISPSSLSNYNASGGSKTITITSSGTWSVSTSQNWISFSRVTGTNGQTTVVTCDSNSSFSPRSGLITFSCGTLTQTVNVYQDGVQPVITVDPTSISNVSSSGGTYQFSITSNCDWTITSDSWITISGTSSGSGNRSNIQITVASNSGSSRTGYIYVSDDDGRAETATITISQSGTAPIIHLDEVIPRGINWKSDANTYADKQSWQVEFNGGDTSKTYTNISVVVQSADSGRTIATLVNNETVTVGANQTVYLGLDANAFETHRNAQLNYDGFTVSDDPYVILVYGNNLNATEGDFIETTY